MYKFFICFVLACSINSFAKPITPEEFPDLDFPILGTPLKLINWRIIQEDDIAFAAPDFDDSKWHKIEVGQSLLEQNIVGPWVWYRVSFDLPENWTGYAAMLDLGRASVYDEIFINGVKCGKFGNPPPKFVYGSSDVYRQYPVSSELLMPGKRNILAVRLYIGAKGGLYDGTYTLNKIPNKTVFFKFNLKVGGKNSLKTMLTKAKHLNKVPQGQKILINPGLVCLDATIEDELLVELKRDGGSLIESKKYPIKLNPGEWCQQLISLAPINIPGSYSCELSLKQFKEKIDFQVTDDSARLKFTIPTDTTLTDEVSIDFPIKVTPGPLGRYGPREYLPEMGLHDDLNAVDSRTGMSYMVRTGKKQGAPQLFLANTRPVPKNHKEVGRFHRAPGHQWDALSDSWIYGHVYPNRAGKMVSLSLDSASWTGRSWLWKYESGEKLKFTVSTISPAWRAESSCVKLRVFNGCTKLGVGLPQYLAYQSKDGIKIVNADAGIKDTMYR